MHEFQKIINWNILSFPFFTCMRNQRFASIQPKAHKLQVDKCWGHQSKRLKGELQRSCCSNGKLCIRQFAICEKLGSWNSMCKKYWGKSKQKGWTTLVDTIKVCYYSKILRKHVVSKSTTMRGIENMSCGKDCIPFWEGWDTTIKIVYQIN